MTSTVRVYRIAITAADGEHAYTVASWGDEGAARRIAWRRYVQDSPDGQPLRAEVTESRACPRNAQGLYDPPRDAILDRREW